MRCLSFRRPSVVRLVIISRPLSKTDPRLLYGSVLGKSRRSFCSRTQILSQTLLSGDMRVYNTDDVQLLVRTRVRHSVTSLQLLSTEQTVVSPPMLSTVVNRVRRSEPVVHNHRRPLC